MTIYLKFESQEQAEFEINKAGFTLSEYKDHFSGNGWGTIFVIPDIANAARDADGMIVEIPLIAGVHANIYDYDECELNLVPFIIPAPNNPFNRVAL